MGQQYFVMHNTQRNIAEYLWLVPTDTHSVQTLAISVQVPAQRMGLGLHYRF